MEALLSLEKSASHFELQPQLSTYPAKHGCKPIRLHKLDLRNQYPPLNAREGKYSPLHLSYPAAPWSY